MPRTILKNLGLSENESKVYLITLSLGSTAASIIAKKCGLKRTSAYPIIDKLKHKGFLTSYKKGSINYYSAIDPEVLVDKCKNKLNSAKNNLNKMEKMLPIFNGLISNTQKVEVKYFEGFGGIKAMLEDVVKSKQNVMGILAIHKICKKVYDYIDTEYSQKRRSSMSGKSKIIVLNDNSVKDYMSTHYESHQFEQIMLKSKEFQMDVSIQIYGNKVAIYEFENEENLYGVLIESETTTKTLSSMFNLIWEYGKLKAKIREN